MKKRNDQAPGRVRHRRRALARTLPGLLIGLSLNGESAAQEGHFEPEPTTLPAVQSYVARRSTAGTKTDTPLIETPQSISVVTRDEMDAHAANSVLEVLRYVPGAATETHGVDPRGYEYFNLRGFINAQTTSNFLNGLRQVPGGFGMFRSEPYGLERIEILRGPGSVMFGQGDPGGIINRVSKVPGVDQVNEVRTELGNFDRRVLGFDVGGPVAADDALLYRVVGLARDGDTQFEYGNGERGNNDRQYLAPSLTWQPSADTRLTLLGEYMRDRTGSGRWTLPDAEGNATRLMVGDPNFDEQDNDQWSVGYLFEHRLNDTWTVRQNFRYASLNSSYRVIDALGLEDDGHTLTREAVKYNSWVNNLLLDTQAQATFSTGTTQHTVLLGVDWMRMNDHEKRWFGDAPSLDIDDPVYGVHTPMPDNLFRDSDERLQQVGLYAQDQVKFDDTWVLTLSGRQDWSKDKLTDHLEKTKTSSDDDAFTWRLGLTYLGAHGIAPYASYATGFLPQPDQDRHGNPFEPERARQYEVGVKIQPPGSRMLFTAALFDLTKRNVLTPDPVDLDFSVQTGEIRSRGLELEAKAELSPGLNMTAAYTYTDAEVTESNDVDLGKRPILVPEHLASLWADYTIHSGDWSGLGFGVGVRYIGENYSDIENTHVNDAQTLLDAVAHYDYGAWRFALNASNLTDEKYASCFIGTCVWAPERTVIASVRYRW